MMNTDDTHYQNWNGGKRRSGHERRESSQYWRIYHYSAVILMVAILTSFIKFSVNKNYYKGNIECLPHKNEKEKKMFGTKGVQVLVDNLKSILLEEQNYDVVLKVQDYEFKAHRTILMARSPVFASMFKHGRKENLTDVIDISDCSAAAFEVFLLYLYTGSINITSSNNVFDLFYTAVKYQVDSLRSECVEYLKNNLSIENFFDVMTLSYQFGESDLQRKATDFFCFFVKAIIKTPQWQIYLRVYTTQANDLLIKAFGA